MKGLTAFVAGAAAGAGIAYLLTSDDCRALRRKMHNYLRKKGLVESTEVDELVDLIAMQVTANSEK